MHSAGELTAAELETAHQEVLTRTGVAALDLEIQRNAVDFMPSADSLKRAGSDAVLVWADTDAVAGLLIACRQIGQHSEWLLSCATTMPRLTQLAGQAANGMLALQFLADPNDTSNLAIPGIREFCENLPRYNPQIPVNTASLYGWGQGRLMREILTRTGQEMTSGRLMEAALSLKAWTDLAPVTYTEVDRRGVTQVWMACVTDSRMVKVSYPLDSTP